MKKTTILLLLSTFNFSFLNCYSQSEQQLNWSIKFGENKVFIPNSGQFDDMDYQNKKTIKYGVKLNEAQIYFSSTGLTYRYDILPVLKNKERDEIKSIKPQIQLLHMEWLNCSTNATIIEEGRSDDYFCYDTKVASPINYIHGVKYITYKNLYPGIDVKYSFHDQTGIKYALIIHPGADISVVKMSYNGYKKNALDSDGNLHFSLPVGDIIDHAPKTFYENGATVNSSFKITGNTVSFSVDPSYDHTKTLIIDPWTTNPTFPNENKAYDVETDSLGNLYVYDGKNPYQLKKYSATGSLLWTYVSGFTGWYGDLAVNKKGEAWISEGYNAANIFPNISEISPNGTLVKTTSSNSNLEFWCLKFNSNYSKLIVSGGTITARISNIRLSDDSAVGTKNYTLNSEVRSMTNNTNGNYYCITSTNNELIAFDSLFNELFVDSDGYSLTYSSTLYNTGFTTGDASSNSITTNKKYIYTSDGATVKKWGLNTGSSLGSDTLPHGSSMLCSGILADDCGFVYVGTSKGVAVFDSSLNYINSISTPGEVYGMCFGINNEVIVCGNTFIASLISNNCSPLGIPQLNPNDQDFFTIQPNPGKNIFEVFMSENTLPESMAVTDNIGRQVYSEQFKDRMNKTQIDLTTKSNGIYFITLTSAKGVQTKKIIKE